MIAACVLAHTRRPWRGLPCATKPGPTSSCCSDGAHRLDLWNASSDLSMFIYNSHFINNVITYPPFMAGTNKPYVNGKVLYVNVRFRCEISALFSAVHSAISG